MIFNRVLLRYQQRLTLCVRERALRAVALGRGFCWGAKKLEARKMLDKAAEFPAFSARCVSWRLWLQLKLSIFH